MRRSGFELLILLVTATEDTKIHLTYWHRSKSHTALLVEFAWRWLKFQPESAMSQWFHQRFGIAGKRSRRIGIIAMARHLAIALWRFVEHREVPVGAILKTVDA